MRVPQSASWGNAVTAPLLFVAAVALGLLIGTLIFVNESLFWPVAIAGGLLLLWVILSHPDLGLAILVFLVYTRFSDVLERQYGAPSFTLPLALLLLLSLLVRWWFLQEPIHNWEKTAVLIAAYGFVGFISLLYAADPDRTQAALVEYAKNAVLLIIVVMALRHQPALRYVIWALLAAGIFMGTLTIYQQLTGTFENDYGGFARTEIKNIISNVNDYRAAGPVGSSNYYALILVPLAPVALDRVWHEKRAGLRLLALYALTVCVLSIIFTFSRGGFVALSLVLLYLLARHAFRPRNVILALIALVMVLYFVPANYTERLATTLDLLPGSGVDARNEVSFRGRTSEVMVAWHIFLDHPIGGVGLNNYKYYYQEYAQPLGWDNRREERSAHNLYLEIAAETGLLGLTTFGAILMAAFWGMRQTRTSLIQTGQYDAANMVGALAIGLGGFLIGSLFLHGAYARFFWLLTGVALAIPQIAAWRPDYGRPRPFIAGDLSLSDGAEAPATNLLS